MNGILAAMAALSVVFAAFQGKMDAVSSAALSEGVRAVELILTLVASLCFWSGLMEVAKEGGVIRWITKLLRPVIRLLFPNAAGDPELSGILCLNLTANLLGLGNAATPLGLQAMEALSARSGCPNTATDEMVTLMLLNSCSLQLIPSTAASPCRRKRGAYGDPFSRPRFLRSRPVRRFEPFRPPLPTIP